MYPNNWVKIAASNLINDFIELKWKMGFIHCTLDNIKITELLYFISMGFYATKNVC